LGTSTIGTGEVVAKPQGNPSNPTNPASASAQATTALAKNPLRKDSGSIEGINLSAELYSESVRLPAFLQYLGASAKDSFTSQQLDMIQVMYGLLRDGIEVIKHGASGSPRERMLYCDEQLTFLYWLTRTSGSSANGGRTSAAERRAAEEEMKERAEEEDKIGQSGSKHSGLFGWSKTDADRVLLLKDVVDIRDEIETEVMKRSLRKGHVVRAAKGSRRADPRANNLSVGSGFVSVNGTKVLSVLAVSRSLDLEIAEADYDRLFHALQVLVNYQRARRLDDAI
jgi:hypothetical protein